MGNIAQFPRHWMNDKEACMRYLCDKSIMFSINTICCLLSMYCDGSTYVLFESYIGQIMLEVRRKSLQQLVVQGVFVIEAHLGHQCPGLTFPC